MEALKHHHLLLLDLDGVVVYEAGPPLSSQFELLQLHRDLGCSIERFGGPVVVLTHRSRAEAAHILNCVGLEGDIIAGIIAAEDLLAAALKTFRIRDLVRGGLLKSLVLPVVELRYAIRREKIAFIDDRLRNINDLLEGGVGLAMLAPSAISSDGRILTSFDFDEASSAFCEWQRGLRKDRLVRLAPQKGEVSLWQRTGSNTILQSRSLFNLARRVGRSARLLR